MCIARFQVVCAIDVLNAFFTNSIFKTICDTLSHKTKICPPSSHGTWALTKFTALSVALLWNRLVTFLSVTNSIPVRLCALIIWILPSLNEDRFVSPFLSTYFDHCVSVEHPRTNLANETQKPKHRYSCIQWKICVLPRLLPLPLLWHPREGEDVDLQCCNGLRY